jgi:hypothetical protein
VVSIRDCREALSIAPLEILMIIDNKEYLTGLMSNSTPEILMINLSLIIKHTSPS